MKEWKWEIKWKKNRKSLLIRNYDSPMKIQKDKSREIETYDWERANERSFTNWERENFERWSREEVVWIVCEQEKKNGNISG